MEILDKIQSTIGSLDQKTFYRYCGGILGTITILLLLLIFQYYRSTRALTRELGTINELRTEVHTILTKAQHIKKGQKEMDAIIAQDPSFKIAGYFEDLISRLGFAQKKASSELKEGRYEGSYRESLLQAQFVGMTMKELTELLQEIDTNKRVFTKELEISQSKKKQNTIDASITIATLEPKPKEVTESSE